MCKCVCFSLQVAEPLASTLRSGNLSVLKKRWEQQQQPSSHRAQPQTTPCHPADARTHIRHSTGPRPTRTSQIEAQPDTQDTEPGTRVHFETSETSFNQLQSAQSEDLTDMEAKPSRDSQGPEGAAAEVPDSEKPSVPLNSLKMMFEKGENLSDKASLFLSVTVTSRFRTLSRTDQSFRIFFFMCRTSAGQHCSNFNVSHIFKESEESETFFSFISNRAGF